MKLEIDILSNPKEFVNEWSLYYDYGNTYLYTDNIKNGAWSEIKCGNPVLFDAKNARNGGLFYKDKILYRVSQSRSKSIYGQRFSINQVIKISANEYIEKHIQTIYPNFKDDIIGTHHFHCDDKYSVVDFCRKY